MARARGVTARPAGQGPVASLARKAKSYIDTWRSILILARRPDESEFNLLFKLNLLGFTLVGGIGYIIHLIYVLLTS
ncbi:protein translocase SEC61 complex subunit gamma [Stetteria hydrogenophila]